MNKSDPFHNISESVLWSMENFSADDEVGVIAFKENVEVLRPLTSINNQPSRLDIKYSGKSNAGSALLAAIDMMSNKFHTERYIIFFSDGEDILDKSAQNLRSVENFQAGLEQAKWLGIPVYILSLRYDENPPNYHNYGKNAREIPTHYKDLMTTVRTIVYSDFHAPHIELPIKNSAEGNLAVEVPVSAQRLKILLLASNPGTAELSGISAKKIINESFVKIFEGESYSQRNFELALKYPAGTGLTLDVIPTVKGRLQTLVTSSFFDGNVLTITPLYDDDSAGKILDNDFFQGKSIDLKIDGVRKVGNISDGSIKIELSDDAEIVSLQKVNFEDVGIIFVGDTAAQITVKQTNYVSWLIAFAAVAVIGILSWRITVKKRRLGLSGNVFSKSVDAQNIPSPVDKFFAKPLERQTFFFNGKLSIYVTKNPDGETIAPLEFNLFQTDAAQISLAEILKACGVDKYFPEANGIIFTPTVSGISVKNDSDCTAFKKNDLVEKGRSVELIYSDSLNVVTPDESAELILTYKSLKPTEAKI